MLEKKAGGKVINLLYERKKRAAQAKIKELRELLVDVRSQRRVAEARVVEVLRWIREALGSEQYKKTKLKERLEGVLKELEKT